MRRRTRFLVASVLSICLQQGVIRYAAAQSTSLSLDDLGFAKSELTSNPKLQSQLEERSSMLKTHQTLGIITAVPLVAQFLLSGNVSHNSAQRDAHAALGIATFALYATTASYAIFAPKPDGLVEDKGNIKIHRALAWVHAPLMVITPILGGIAYKQRNNNEKVHGLGDLHGAAATALLISYLASIAVLSFDF